jgi:hypothetical protein
MNYRPRRGSLLRADRLLLLTRFANAGSHGRFTAGHEFDRGAATCNFGPLLRAHVAKLMTIGRASKVRLPRRLS